ncbi:MAG: UDP-N-acetylglucosamine 1-carboxyvinyltransferase [Clostridia bacterium]|nr:UDP-N-acetylglucosamine 1-carboxyvinyltransferase [Clostridia bacterium]
MDKFVITGGNKIKGSIDISGSKNSVLPILAATLLISDTCIINNVPRLRDVYTMVELLKYYGAEVEFDESIKINCSNIENKPPSEKVKDIRASFLLVGALLGRFKRVSMFMPGGCNIGQRPVDLHLKGFSVLGANQILECGIIDIFTKYLNGGEVYLDFPSVGATENVILAAVMAKGRTVISNCAIEPEIVDLADFLTKAGAKISGAGSDTIIVDGVDSLKGVEHSVIPDRIEAGTFMLAVAGTGGQCRINNVITEHIKPVILKLREMEVDITEEDDAVVVYSNGNIVNTDIKTMPYPGFPTDMQAQFTALMSKGAGTGIVNETVFENRFMHIGELIKMGANIAVEGRTAVVRGVETLAGAEVKATDLRAGAALIISALSAEGTTEIGNIHYIDRGYEMIEKKLSAVGCEIKRIEG